MGKIFLLVLLFVSKNQANFACELNDNCTVWHDYEGTVVLASECGYLKSLANFEQRKITPCGFQARAALICCPKPEFDSGQITNRFLVRKAEAACISFGRKPYDDVDEPRILGGNRSDVGEFPHFASLGYQTDEDNEISFECGGALISDRYVLTAAHCCKRSRPPLMIRLGRTSLDLTDPNDTSRHIDAIVKRIIPHPDYISSEKYNDIALIELARPVKFSRYIWPACLQVNNKYISKDMTIAGFGRTSKENANLKSNWLLKGFVDETPLTECRNEYDAALKGLPIKNLGRGITDNLICAKNGKYRIDTCQGDSGSAIQHYDNDIAFVVGVTSFGIGCGSKLSSFYTRVPSYVDWIEKIVWKDSFEDAGL